MKTKKKLLVTILIAALTMLASTVSVLAATKNPLAKMPRQVGSVASEINCVSVTNKTAFYTEAYNSKVSISVKNSNPKVADVQYYSTKLDVNGKLKNCGYFGVRYKKTGTTTITVTVKVNGKTYKRSCKYTFYKYTNPFKLFKKGNKNITAEFKSAPSASVYSDVKGKYSYRLKNGYKVTRILYWDQRFRGHEVKNISQVPSNPRRLYLTIENTKKNYLFTWVLS